MPWVLTTARSILLTLLRPFSFPAIVICMSLSRAVNVIFRYRSLPTIFRLSVYVPHASLLSDDPIATAPGGAQDTHTLCTNIA